VRPSQGAEYPTDQAKAQVSAVPTAVPRSGCESQRTSKASRGYNSEDGVARGSVRALALLLGALAAFFCGGASTVRRRYEWIKTVVRLSRAHYES